MKTLEFRGSLIMYELISSLTMVSGVIPKQNTRRELNLLKIELTNARTKEENYKERLRL